MNIEQIKAATNAGLQVCWASLAYTVEADTGASCGFSIVYEAGSPKENRIGLTWSDGTTINGDADDFFVNYNRLTYVVDDALSEQPLESVLCKECRYVGFQIDSELVWVAVFSYLDGMIDKEAASELAADLLIEMNQLTAESNNAPAFVI